jgi:hypothetical protein
VDTAAVDSELFEPGAIAFGDPDGNRVVARTSLGVLPGVAFQCALIGSQENRRKVRLLLPGKIANPQK